MESNLARCNSSLTTVPVKIPSPISIADGAAADAFRRGNIVFRVTAHPPGTIPPENGVSGEEAYKGREYRMVMTNEDYGKKLLSHRYTSLLYCSSLELRLAYLFGCLNFDFDVTRREDFVFWWRQLGTYRWHLWFVVRPYDDIV